MKPIKKFTSQSNFLKPWLSIILDQYHELCQLAKHIDWKFLENEFEQLFVQDKGAPAKPVRLVVGIMMLQHMYDFSDEGAVKEWVENPYWQFFCGEQQLQIGEPINPSSLTRWRKRIGQDGMNEILSETIKAALITGTVSQKNLKKVIVDTTVMEKNITFPTDAKIQYKAIERLVKMAKGVGIKLHQTYLRIGHKRLIRSVRYAHARQMKKARRERDKIKTYLGRLYRFIQKQIENNEVLQCIFKKIFEIIEKILKQTRESKDKIYSIHEPDVDCISKGKVHKKYEFGCKASFVITHKEGLALSAMAFHKNPYDGHTLQTALKDAEKISNNPINQVYVDKGYKGHKIEDKTIFISGIRRITNWFKKQLKRRQAIEPHIGHMKNDGKLGRNYLKGKLGDILNVILCGIGHNLRMIARHLRESIPIPV